MRRRARWSRSPCAEESSRCSASREMDARELSQALGIKEKEVYEHLVHVERSATAAGARFIHHPQPMPAVRLRVRGPPAADPPRAAAPRANAPSSRTLPSGSHSRRRFHPAAVI
ncbi:MAG: hypothetical protein MZV70_41000 [Desulfobacterales bacterium]|nr:hypothetical protein [Desulfobacterales bacterium]